MVVLSLFASVCLAVCVAVLTKEHIHLHKEFKTLLEHDKEISKIISEIQQPSEVTEEDEPEEESKEISPYEYADMILRGKVDIENELRE